MNTPNSRESVPLRPFCMRLVVIDHYMSKPVPGLDVCYSEFTGSSIQRVPVVRIFGATPSGQAACLHLHKAFPYFYIPYDDDLPNGTEEEVSQYLRQVGMGLESALQAGKEGEEEKRETQHIHNIQLVRGRKFYGYHANDSLFMKIVLYDPRDVSRASSLLSRGVVLGRKFQPHEAHIPFLLHVKVDLNLYGMSELKLSSVTFRDPVPDKFVPRIRAWQEANAPTSKETETHSDPTETISMRSSGLQTILSHVDPWTSETIPESWLWSERRSGRVPRRQSTCELEVDATVDAVLNKLQSIRSPLETTGANVRMVESLIPMWDEEEKRLGHPPKVPSSDLVRNPQPLCDIIKSVREELKVVARNQMSFVPEAECELRTPPPQQSMQIMETPVYRITQPANSLTGPHGPSSAIPQTPQAVQFGGKRQELGAVEDLVDAEALQQAMAAHGEEFEDDDIPDVDDPLMALAEAALGDEPSVVSSKEEAAKKLSVLYEEQTRRELNDIKDSSQGPESEFMTDAAIAEVGKSIDSSPMETKSGSQSNPKRAKGRGTNESQGHTAKRKRGRAQRDNARRVKQRKPEARTLSQTTIVLGSDHQKLRTTQSHTSSPVPSQRSRKRSAFARKIYRTVRSLMLHASSGDEVNVPRQVKKIGTTNSWPERRSEGRKEPRKSLGMPIKGSAPCLDSSPVGNGVVEHVAGVNCETSSKKQSIALRPLMKPPSPAEVESSVSRLLPVMHKEPFYGDDKHNPEILQCLEAEDMHFGECLVSVPNPFKDHRGNWVWAPTMRAPSPSDVKDWLRAKQKVKASPTGCANFGMDPNTGSLMPSRKGMSSARDPSFDESLVSSMDADYMENGECGIAPVQEILEDRPPSPKYDERTCFFASAYTARVTPHQPNRVAPSAMHRSVLPATHQATESTGKTPGLADSMRKAAQGTLSRMSPVAAGGTTSRPTPVSQAGFKMQSEIGGPQLLVASVEVHADCRGSLLPDPRYDAVRCIVLAVGTDNEEDGNALFQTHVLILDKGSDPQYDGLMAMRNCTFRLWGDEQDLLLGFVECVRLLDPDVILGFEVQNNSMGYLVERANTMDINLLRLVSRVPELASQKELQKDEYGQTHGTGYHITGRVILNLWRILRTEIKLNIYTFENCVANILQERVPFVKHTTLHGWFVGGRSGGRWRCISYFVRRARLDIAIVEQLDLMGRTSEMARTFGIDFFSVIIRGSQYRVESMVVRLAHTQNYILVSPSKERVHDQPAMECLPLVMEPESKMYSSPVVVLDFQSLYPSMIIAYNLCYSTCVGKVAHAASAGRAVQLGATDFKLPPGTLSDKMDPDALNIMPNSVCYASPSARPGILPRLLNEILTTRIMVKSAMRSAPKTQKVLQRCLNARQFGLKMIANVTYGYTAAGFSGRMPFAELADSIVQSGRETLQNAITMVESNSKWNARVVYGDSVVGETPLLLRVDGRVVVRRIDGLGGEWKQCHGGKEVCELTGVESWTEAGWSPVRCVIRHRLGAGKGLVRVQTLTGMVVCTTDHSLLRSNGRKVAPREVLVGDDLMHSFPPLEHSHPIRSAWALAFQHELLHEPSGKTFAGLKEASDWSGLPIEFISSLVSTPASAWRSVRQTRSITLTPEFGRLWGMFVMNGRCGCQPSWAIESTDRSLLIIHRSIAERIFPEFEWVIRRARRNGRYELVPNHASLGALRKFVDFWQSIVFVNGERCISATILNASRDIRRAFWYGLCDAGGASVNEIHHEEQQVGLGIVALLRSLGVPSVIVDTYNDGRARDAYRYRGLDCSPEDVNRVRSITPVRAKKDTFVYDLTTNNHHFHAGVGDLIVHNTDSMFVLLEGRSRGEAFRIGQEIAEAVTSVNPAPVELKMEKVYHPCVLQSKKHYVGFMYETPSQQKPTFDAKGIETVRRDACPVVAKMMEKVLRILFSSKDLSQVRAYMCKQWSKILSGRILLQDFVFAKEVRLGTYSPKNPGIIPPAAIVAAKAMTNDPRAEPRYAQRIPYVVVYGEPGARLVDMVVDPHMLLESQGRLRLHAVYYITKQINPAIDRMLVLVGADVASWFVAMPRPQRMLPQKRPVNAIPAQGVDTAFQSGGTIDAYYLSRHCAVCDELTYANQPVCPRCLMNPQLAAVALANRSKQFSRRSVFFARACLSCGGGGACADADVEEGAIVCMSLDCPVYFERKKLGEEARTVAGLVDVTGDLFERLTFNSPCI